MKLFKRKKQNQYEEVQSKHCKLSAQGTHIGMAFGCFGLMLTSEDAADLAMDILVAVRAAKQYAADRSEK